jgi:MoxR-like ATPase
MVKSNPRKTPDGQLNPAPPGLKWVRSHEKYATSSVRSWYLVRTEGDEVFNGRNLDPTGVRRSTDRDLRPAVSFKIKRGPVFTNLLLADEINRAPAKVQSALLEVMQERQVTIGDETFKIDLPFLVMATQNPVEQEGAYELPEAQLDRFLMKVVVGYNTKDEELEIARRVANRGFGTIEQVASIDDLNTIRREAMSVYIDEEVEKYIVELVFATREPEQYGLEKIAPYIEFGASPRASIDMYKASRAVAYLKGRDFVSPIEVGYIAKEILRHRIVLSYEAEADGVTQDSIIDEVLRAVDIP